MGSQAYEAFFNINPVVLLLAVFGIFYVIKECIEAVKYIEKTFGLEKKSDIERRNIHESVDKLNVSVKEFGKKFDGEMNTLRNDIYTRIDVLQANLDEVSECNKNIAEASREELADKINLKYKNYFKLGYIPYDEYDEFVNLHRAYKLVGGNHSGDAKFERCCKNLEIRNDTPENMQLTFDDYCDTNADESDNNDATVGG